MLFKEFKAKYEHKAVFHFPTKVSSKPVVSVCVVTYNHVNYIRQCLDGILNQKTDFDFEIILGDDASTDGTREICIEYARRYPDIVRLFLHHRENNIKIVGQPSGRFNFLYNLYSAQGKYIALCDGDDYWIDPFKLQKQLEFLNENDNFIAVFTDINVLNDSLITQQALKDKHKNDHNFNSFFKNAWIPTLTLVFEAKFIHDLPENPEDIISGDILLFAHLLSFGDFKFFDQVTGVYRKHPNGIWSGANQLKILNNRIELNKYFIQKYCNDNTKLNKFLKDRINVNYLKKAKLHKSNREYFKMISCLIKSRF
jgi:glycosyltransferase involved in cell wall biosynthesis